MKVLLSFFLTFISFIAVAQNRIIFNYDDAGNQIYRGKNPNDIKEEFPFPPKEIIDHGFSVPTEEQLWNKYINAYPVPVQTTLTIKYKPNNSNRDDLSHLKHITVYEHGTMQSLIDSEIDIKTAYRGYVIDMTNFRSGVYVVKVQLSDGRYLSKNILKL